MKSTKRVVVSVDEDFYQRLEAIAGQETRSVPNLLLWLAQKGLKSQEQQAKAS
jgi:hypothetical protein